MPRLVDVGGDLVVHRPQRLEVMPPAKRLQRGGEFRHIATKDAGTGQRNPGRVTLCQQFVARPGELVEFLGLLGDPVSRPLLVLAAGNRGSLLDQLPDIVTNDGDAVFEFG